ncbi:MAG TPA: GAF domain-containing protein, partial [Vicinamibacterales bacterium]|nr:GAF domain-containing protein [Vicinamibacterales bacterium]
PPAAPPPAHSAAVSEVDLKALADLCLELARISDTRPVPRLLERAARLLDATGLIVWVADPDGRELHPVMAHGYPPAALARIGPIPRDADNATAAAFREGEIRIVRSDAFSHGAIAAPLVAPSGCVGVVAAEVLHEREQRPAARAAAAIIAAQLASLLAPSAPPSAARAAERGARAAP